MRSNERATPSRIGLPPIQKPFLSPITPAARTIKTQLDHADPSAMRKVIDPAPMAKVVIGSVGVLYGAAILLRAILKGLDAAPADSPAYQGGQFFGLVIAAAVLFFGARYALRGLAERKASRSAASAPEDG
jgi:hypothetical protein